MSCADLCSVEKGQDTFMLLQNTCEHAVFQAKNADEACNDTDGLSHCKTEVSWSETVVRVVLTATFCSDKRWHMHAPNCQRGTLLAQ